MTASAKSQPAHRSASRKPLDRRGGRGSASPLLMIPRTRFEAERDAVTLFSSFVDEVLESKTADEARRELRRRSESVGLVLLASVEGILAGYDPHVVSAATAERAAMMAEQPAGFSGGAKLRFRHALEVSALASHELLRLNEAGPSPLPNVAEISRSLARLRCVEAVALIVASGAGRPRSKAVGLAIAEEFSLVALATYRAVRGGLESPRALEDAIDLELARQARRGGKSISHAEAGRRLGLSK